MIDLGAWLDGEYVIPGPPSELADDPADGEPGDRSPVPPEGGLPAGAGGAKGRDSRR